jgi:hypothetical protein
MPQAISGDCTVVVVPGQVSSDLAGEVVILGLQSGRYYTLDEVGADVWNLVQQPKTVRTIRDTILEEYDVDPSRCTEDLGELLQKLAAAGLIEIRHESPE